MSGGHFNYKQYEINEIADEIERLITENDSDNGERFSPSVIERFKEAVHTLRQASEMAQRVDWLVSCDDAEKSFESRWKKEVRPYYKTQRNNDGVHKQIDDDAVKHDMADMDVAVAWRLGLAAWEAARKLGAKFPHE